MLVQRIQILRRTLYIVNCIKNNLKRSVQRISLALKSRFFIRISLSIYVFIALSGKLIILSCELVGGNLVRKVSITGKILYELLCGDCCFSSSMIRIFALKAS